MTSAETCRCPPAADGLQVNTCRNLRCRNYGAPPHDRVDRGRHLATGDDYVAVSVGNRQHGLRCKVCGEAFTTKSNLAIIEELQRLREQSTPVHNAGCATENCPNFRRLETSPPSRYQSFGHSAGGSQRWRCKACRKTFTTPTRATLRQMQMCTFAVHFVCPFSASKGTTTQG